MKFFFIVVIFLIALLGAFGEEESVQLEGKVADYYALLLKHPRQGYLFERFCASWLEKGNLHGLQTFLEQEKSGNSTLLLAFFYEMNKEPMKALKLYATLLKKDPDWKEVLFFRGKLLVGLKKYSEASTDLKKLRLLKPKQSLQFKMLKLLGRSLLREGKTKQALKVWRELLVVSGNDPDVADELLEVLISEGLYGDALILCNQQLHIAHENFRKVLLFLKRANVLVSMNRKVDAVESLQKAFGLTGRGSWLQRDVLERIKEIFLKNKDWSGLTTFAKQLLNKNPKNPILIQLYVVALMGKGENVQALKQAQELVRMMPDHREVKEWYIELLKQQHLYNKALAVLTDFLKHYPEDNLLRLELATVCHQAKKDKQALVWAKAFIKYSLKKQGDYFLAAQLLARKGMDNEARVIYQDLVKAYPRSMEAREALIRHLKRTGSTLLVWDQYTTMAKDADLETLFGSGNQSELDQASLYFEYLRDNKPALLEDLVEQVEKKLADSKVVVSIDQEICLRNLFRSAVLVGDTVQRNKALEVASKVNNRYHNNEHLLPKEMMLRLGVLPFNLCHFNTKTGSMYQQVLDYKKMDRTASIYLKERILARQKWYIANGFAPSTALYRCWVELIDEWTSKGGSHQFYPIASILKSSYFNYNLSVLEKDALQIYIHSTTNNSLMLAQVRAGFSTVWRDRFSWSIPDRRAQDMETFFNRSDLDLAAKMNFFRIYFNSSHKPIWKTFNIAVPLWRALFSDPKLFKASALSVFEFYPIPADKTQTALYQQVGDRLLRQPDMIGRKHFEFLLARLLFKLGRRKEALLSLNKNPKQYAFYRCFVEGYKNNICIWRVDPTQDLSSTLKTLKRLDEKMYQCSEVQRIRRSQLEYVEQGKDKQIAYTMAVIDWIHLWCAKDRPQIFFPLHFSLSQAYYKIVTDPESLSKVEKCLDDLSVDSQISRQCRALFAIEKLIYVGGNFKKEMRWIREYTDGILTDAERLTFLRSLRGRGMAYRCSFPGQAAVVQIIFAHPELEELFAPYLVEIYPVPKNEQQRHLYHRVMNQELAALKKRRPEEEWSSGYRNKMGCYLKTLHVLGRNKEFHQLLVDEAFGFPQHLGPFMMVLESDGMDWCLESFIQTFVKWTYILKHDFSFLQGKEVSLNKFYARLPDSETRRIARIFFAVANPDESELKKCLVEYKKCDFTNVAYAVLAKKLFAENGFLPNRATLTPLLKKWADAGGIMSIVKAPEKMNPMSWSVFREYVTGLLNNGQIDKVIAIYKTLNQYTFKKADLSWIAEAPFFELHVFCDELKQGKPVSLPSSFSNIDFEKYVLLLNVIESGLQKNHASTPLFLSRDLQVVLRILRAQKKPKLLKYIYYQNKKENLFPLYVLFSGLANGAPNEIKMKIALQWFFCAERKKGDVPQWIAIRKEIGFSWMNAVLSVYPYSLNPKKWEKELKTLLPSRPTPPSKNME